MPIFNVSIPILSNITLLYKHIVAFSGQSFDKQTGKRPMNIELPH
jgi:hypothetical protein